MTNETLHVRAEQFPCRERKPTNLVSVLRETHANPSYVGLETAAVFAYLCAAVHLWLRLDRISNELRPDATGSECFSVARLNYINDFSCERMDTSTPQSLALAPLWTSWMHACASFAWCCEC